MCFEDADCTFRCISMMDMGWYQLLSHSPLRFDDALVFSTCCIVQYLEVYQHVAVFKPLHDGAVGKESMFVGAQLEGSGNYFIGIAVICYHYVLIST